MAYFFEDFKLTGRC